jgi:hypothetical protein
MEYDIGPWGGQGFLQENRARIRLDIYRVLATIFASSAFHHIEHTADDAFGRLASDFELVEIEHRLVNIAASVRVLLDSHSPRTEWDRLPCGSLWKNRHDVQGEHELGLREACNKIIHARIRNLDVDDYEVPTGLEPFVHLYGEQLGTDWKATVDLVRFAAAALRMTEQRAAG